MLGYYPYSRYSGLEYFIMQDATWGGPRHPEIPYTIVFIYDRMLHPSPGAESSTNVQSPSNHDTTHVPVSIVNQNGIP